MEINNVNDLSKIMQPVLVGLVDQLANRVYETLNFFLQSYYDSYTPVSYRRQYDFLRSAIKVKGRMSRGKAVAYVYIDTESMSNYYNATGYQVATWAKVYAIGVVYDKARGKYLARITPFGHDKQVKLHYWDTEEEAFQEYKLFKESEIRILALRYRDKIPDRLFDALIKYEVRPYSPYEGED